MYSNYVGLCLEVCWDIRLKVLLTDESTFFPCSQVSSVFKHSIINRKMLLESFWSLFLV